MCVFTAPVKKNHPYSLDMVSKKVTHGKNPVDKQGNVEFFSLSKNVDSDSSNRVYVPVKQVKLVESNGRWMLRAKIGENKTGVSRFVSRDVAQNLRSKYGL